MFNFNGGTTLSGASLAPLGMYAGYLLSQSGNFWVAAFFLTVTLCYFLIVVCTLVRFIVNYRRYRHLLESA
jgi:Flp pilus assembly protein TadB